MQCLSLFFHVAALFQRKSISMQWVVLFRLKSGQILNSIVMSHENLLSSHPLFLSSVLLKGSKESQLTWQANIKLCYTSVYKTT